MLLLVLGALFAGALVSLLSGLQQQNIIHGRRPLLCGVTTVAIYLCAIFGMLRIAYAGGTSTMVAYCVGAGAGTVASMLIWRRGGAAKKPC